MASKSPERRLAVVTGASKGIGYELAKQFAKAYFDVVVVAEDESIFEVPTELEKHGAKVEAFRIDLASREGAEKFYEKVKSLGRPVDALALNAGVGVTGDFVRETDLDEELNLINLNIVSTVVLAKLFGKDMVRRGEGKILITSSVAATMPGPLLAIYAASKSFVQSFAQAIRNELKDSGVTVTALMPSATETDFFRRAHMEETEIGVSEKDHPEDVAKAGFDALMTGKDHVAGSWTAQSEIVMAKLIPETRKAESYRKENEPLHGKKH